VPTRPRGGWVWLFTAPFTTLLEVSVRLAGAVPLVIRHPEGVDGFEDFAPELVVDLLVVRVVGVAGAEGVAVDRERDEQGVDLIGVEGVGVVDDAGISHGDEIVEGGGGS